MATSTGATVRRNDTPDHAEPKIKTSAAAALALVFGVASLFCALTAILSPAAIVLGIIAVIVGIAGILMSRRPHVTGKGVAIGGIVTGVLGLIVAITLVAGAATFLNNKSNVDRLDKQVQKLRDKLPTSVPSSVPTN